MERYKAGSRDHHTDEYTTGNGSSSGSGDSGYQGISGQSSTYTPPSGGGISGGTSHIYVPGN